MNLHRLALLLGILFYSAQLIVGTDLSVIDPSLDGSHRRFINALSNQTERAFQDIIAIYDGAITAHPDDPGSLLEKCRFIHDAFPVGDERHHPKQTDLDSAMRQLAERFPDDPEAVLYRSEQLYGEKRVQFLQRFARPDLTGWSDQQRARLFGLLAWAQDFDNDFAEARTNAEAAMRFDPLRDLSLIIASYYDSKGQKDLVWRALARHLLSEIEPWEKNRKVQLLAKAGRDQEALRIYETFSPQTDEYVVAIDYAGVLERTGHFQAAREQLIKAVTAEWQHDKARLQLFDFDLKHSDESAVVESYRSLCSDGIEVDPLLRRRVAIALKYPTAGWAWPDFARLALLGAGMVILILLPLAYVVPIHYIGLLREKRAAPKPSFEPQWHLGHFWIASVVWLLATFVSLYCFQYDELASFFLDDAVTELALNSESLAPTALTFSAIFAVGVLILQRKRHWLLTINSRWSFSRSFLIVLSALLLSRMTFRSLSVLLNQVAGSLLPMVSFAPAAQSSRGQMIVAFGNEYGTVALFLLLVVAAPLAEELAFRGIFLDSVTRHVPFHVANIGQAVAFAFIHEEMSLFLYFALFGWIAGLMRQRSGGLALPISFHAANNFIAFVQISTR